jgi:hypothetical protein
MDGNNGRGLEADGESIIKIGYSRLSDNDRQLLHQMFDYLREGGSIRFAFEAVFTQGDKAKASDDKAVIAALIVAFAWYHHKTRIPPKETQAGKECQFTCSY